MSAGCHAQMVAKHRARGLPDPRVITRSELLADGVPLAAAKRQTARPEAKKRVRPCIIHANAEYAKHKAALAKAAGKPVKVSRAERHAFMSDHAKSFRDLDPDTQRPSAEIAAQTALLSQTPPAPTPAVIGAGWHWGLGEGALPISVDAQKKAYCDKYNFDDALSFEDLPGLTQRSEDLRDEFLQDTIIDDKGDINPERKFVYQRTCYAKHVGMCETADRARLPTLRKLGKRIKDRAEEKDWYVFWGERAGEKLDIT